MSSPVLEHPTFAESPEKALEDATERLAELRKTGKPCFAIVLMATDYDMPSMFWSAITVHDILACEHRINLQARHRFDATYITEDPE